MQIALVSGERREPQPGLKGACPLCADPVIAKCGTVNEWHWSHKGRRYCDSWKENKTEWHRQWQGNFHPDRREVVHTSNTGIRHIADIKTENGWVLEIQYSAICAEERNSRNEFYEKLAWVVSGERRSTDRKKFLADLQLIGNARGPIIGQVCKVRSSRSALLRDWSACKGPVFFDFGGPALWCLVPNLGSETRYVVEFSRQHFIQIHNFDFTQSSVFWSFIQKIWTTVDHFATRGIGEGSVIDALRELPLIKPQQKVRHSFARPLHRSPRL